MCGEQVYLTLWVRVKEDWRDSDYLLKNLGYDKKDILIFKIFLFSAHKFSRSAQVIVSEGLYGRKKCFVEVV